MLYMHWYRMKRCLVGSLAWGDARTAERFGRISGEEISEETGDYQDKTQTTCEEACAKEIVASV